MDRLLSPENAALLVGAVAGLIWAVAKGVDLISKGVSNYLETRNNINATKAELARLEAEAKARDSEAENEQQARIIAIMERQTDYSHETAKRFATIAEDFLTAQNRTAEMLENHRRTNESVAEGLNNMAAENKALRISMEAWPKAVDGKLDVVDATIHELADKVAAVEAAITQGNTDHSAIKSILQNEIVPGIKHVITLLTATPTPTLAAESVQEGGEV